MTAITPLNEPGGYRPGVTEVAVSYYEAGYKIVRSVAENGLMFFMHDAFKPFSFWDGFMNSAPYENTALDTHIYVMFNDFQVAFNESERIDYFCSLKAPLIRSDQNIPTIVVSHPLPMLDSTLHHADPRPPPFRHQGEWTVAPTDCSQKMDWITYSSDEAFGKQIGSGAHFDGTLPDSAVVGSCAGMSGHASSFSAHYKEYLGRLWEVQVDAFEEGSGWIMWAWVSGDARFHVSPTSGDERRLLTAALVVCFCRKWRMLRTGRTRTGLRTGGSRATPLTAATVTNAHERMAHPARAPGLAYE